MSQTPFMPLWVSDFLGDTLDLNAKEIGAYMLLLMAMWQRDGYLPADEAKLKRVARCGRDWPKIWDTLKRFFCTEGDRITNKRLLQELQKVATKRAVNAQSGARGGHAKALKDKKAALANAAVSPQQPEPEPYIDVDDTREAPLSQKEGLTEREQMLEAMGHDRSGFTASGRMVGDTSDMMEFSRWRGLGLTFSEILACITEVSRQKRDGPPSTFRYFTHAMQKAAGAKSAPALTPITGGRAEPARDFEAESRRRIEAMRAAQ